MSEASFTCSVCGKQAGEIKLADGEVRRASFTSVLTQQVSPAALERLRSVLESEGAPRTVETTGNVGTFSPTTTPYWHDSIRGRCRRGHERMLED